MKKKLSIFIIATLLLLVGATAGFATSMHVTKNIEVTYQTDWKYSIQQNNTKETAFWEEAPFVYQGTTYVPLRYLLEDFGFTLDWDDENRETTIIAPGEIKQENNKPETPSNGNKDSNNKQESDNNDLDNRTGNLPTDLFYALAEIERALNDMKDSVDYWHSDYSDRSDENKTKRISDIEDIYERTQEHRNVLVKYKNEYGNAYDVLTIFNGARNVMKNAIEEPTEKHLESANFIYDEVYKPLHYLYKKNRGEE